MFRCAPISQLDKAIIARCIYLNVRQDPPLKKIHPEIDFFELLHSFWQQKKLIGATTIIVGVMALGYVSFAQQVYQTSSLLRPAAINELGKV